MLVDLQKLVKKYNRKITEVDKSGEIWPTELYVAKCVFEGREFEHEKRTWAELPPP